MFKWTILYAPSSQFLISTTMLGFKMHPTFESVLQKILPNSLRSFQVNLRLFNKYWTLNSAYQSCKGCLAFAECVFANVWDKNIVFTIKGKQTVCDCQGTTLLSRLFKSYPKALRKLSENSPKALWKLSESSIPKALRKISENYPKTLRKQADFRWKLYKSLSKSV